MNQYKVDIKSLIVIHTAMLLGMIIFMAVAFFVANKVLPNPVDESLSRILQVVAVLLSMGGGFMAFMLFKKKIQSIQDMSIPVSEKIQQYRIASIMKFALLEAPVLFCCIGYLLSKNISFLLLAGVLVMIFAGQKPTVIMMTHDMNVSKEDLMQE